jgi:hypothetical protein
MAHQSPIHTETGQCHYRQRCPDLKSDRCNYPADLEFLKIALKQLLAIGLKAYSDLVLGGRLEGHQEDKTCGKKPGGLQDDEADKNDRKNGSHNPVKDHDPKSEKQWCSS